MCRLSIITVNLNNATGLEKTIRSVTSQSFSNFELIVIDGNSEDNSKEIISTFSSQITCWVSEPDSGIYNAMNKGILKSKGDYCLFLNSGDYLVHSHILEEVFSKDISEDIISGDVITYSDKVGSGSVISKINSSDFSLCDLIDTSLNHQATFIKRDLFIRYGLYDERYRIISDWVFSFKTIINYNASFRHIDKVISYYYSDGLSSDTRGYYKSETEHALKELIPERILKDYKTGILQAVMRMKKHWVFWNLFRILNVLTVKYDSMTMKIREIYKRKL